MFRDDLSLARTSAFSAFSQMESLFDRVFGRSLFSPVNLTELTAGLTATRLASYDESYDDSRYTFRATLPDGLDLKQAQATIENGTLVVTIPRRQRPTVTQNIPIDVKDNQ